MTGYGVVPRTLSLLRTYWYWLQMVAKAGGKSGPPFKGHLGVTQCDHFYPKCFKVVVESVIRHWVMVLAPMDSGAEGLGETIHELAAFSMRMMG